jgi:hypothetical protein
MEPISGDALRGHLETMALASLEKGEAHGFEILRRLTGPGAPRLGKGRHPHSTGWKRRG